LLCWYTIFIMSVVDTNGLFSCVGYVANEMTLMDVGRGLKSLVTMLIKRKIWLALMGRNQHRCCYWYEWALPLHWLCYEWDDTDRRWKGTQIPCELWYADRKMIGHIWRKTATLCYW
jgi:hypothetical protein